MGGDQLNLHANPIRIISVGGEQVLCVVHCRLELKQKLYNLTTQILYRQDLISKLSTQSFIYCHQLGLMRNLDEQNTSK